MWGSHLQQEKMLSSWCFCHFRSFFCYPIFSRMTDNFEIQNLRNLHQSPAFLRSFPLNGSHACFEAHKKKKQEKKKQRNIQKVLTNIQKKKIYLYKFIYKRHSREWENKYAQNKVRWSTGGKMKQWIKCKRKLDRAKPRWSVWGGLHLQEVHQRWRNTVALLHLYSMVGKMWSEHGN